MEFAFTPPVLQAGVRAVFGFPLRVGHGAPRGARPLPRPARDDLSPDQHADALVLADVTARWVLEAQAGAPSGVVAEQLEAGADFHFAVHNAAGIVSVQEGISVTDALIRLRAFAYSHDRLLDDVAQDCHRPQTPAQDEPAQPAGGAQKGGDDLEAMWCSLVEMADTW